MDKKTFMAVVLSMAVIFIYQFFLLPKPPPRPVREQQAADKEVPASVAAIAAPAPVQPAETAPQPDAEITRLMQLQEGSGIREVTVVNDLFRVTLNSAGGAVSSWKLQRYADKDGNPLEVAPQSLPGVLPSLSIVFSDEMLTRYFSEGPYRVEGGGSPLGTSHPRETVTLSRVDPSGLLLVKKLSFQDNSYLVDVAVEVKNLGKVTRDIPWWLSWGPGLGRETAISRGSYTGPLIFRDNKLAQDKPKKDKERLSIPPGFQWLGVTNHYFLAAFTPSAREGDAFVEQHDRGKDAPAFSVGAGPRSIFLPPGGSTAFEGKLFIGPKSFELLKSYGLGLENSLDFGWFGWLGKPLLMILKFFYSFVRNWGVAIILLTLLAKVLLFPVTFNMYKSMRKMQDFQPQIAALKKKYKDNPEAMNREMMALYRENKINPMGGCLPMVIQIPIFIALYRVLSLAIELRGAAFLHIQDLSVGENTLGQFIHSHIPSFPEGLIPLKILVILVGVTMFVQQKLSPSMGDPRQAKMMMFLPIIFTAMFWNFTSGLVVYFLFSNLLAIGEQFLIRKWSGPAVTQEKPTKR